MVEYGNEGVPMTKLKASSSLGSPPKSQGATPSIIPVLSLFCGAGGLDLGFNQSGFRSIVAVDIDAAALDSYRKNHPHTVAIELDLSKTPAASIADSWDKNADLPPRGIIGGPPCQGFSIGNRFPSRSDPRNRLPFRYAEILAHFASNYGIDFFVFENVPGLVQHRHRSRFQGIKREFRRAGFVLYEFMVDAADFGVPQHRQRLFLVGFSDSVANRVGKLELRGSQPELHVRDAISKLPTPDFCSRMRAGETPKFHPNHWTMRPKSKRFETQNFEGTRSFRKLSWDQPSWTVAYGNREIHIHPDGTRRLTVLEAMLLQGFPQSYQLCGSFSSQVQQVSNAVPPPLANALAREIHSLLFAND